ncbi:hypothetical protein Cal6303_0617 [Calothrix sp. PCC 6303]|nr:hypothetical protein Cal6303_0617 [Calothrix sp. PCC 6303]
MFICLENSTKKMIQYCGMDILPVLVLVAAKMPAPQEIWGYLFGSLLFTRIY